MARQRRRLLLLKVALALAAVVLIGVVAAGILVWRDLSMPLSERFNRSRSALDAYAAQVSQSGAIALSHPPSRIGSFRILKAEPMTNGFVLQSDFGNPFDWCGLAYSSAPLPQYDKDAKGKIKQVFMPLGGNWYEVFRP
jgi:hypothetical protein